MALLLMAMLLVPAAAADVLQVGVDAARTGVLEEAGPKLDEVAWTIHLPGSTSTSAWPIIIGDHVYIATSDMRHRDDLATNAIWEVSLVDGAARPVIELDPTGSLSGIGSDVVGETMVFPRLFWPHGVVSDGERFYVTGAERVVVYDIATGDEVWDWHYPEFYLEQDIVVCGAAALTQRSLFVGCMAVGRAPGDLGEEDTQSISGAIFVAALDLAEQDEKWLWIREPESELLEEDTPENPTCDPATVGGTCTLLVPRANGIFGISTFGGIVTATYFSVTDSSTGAEYKATVGLDENSGELRWIKQSPRDATDDTEAAAEAEVIDFSFYPAGDDADGYLAFRDLLRIDPRSGRVIASFNLQPRSETVPEVGSSFALTEDRLFFTSTRTLYAIDRHDFAAELWAKPLPSQSTGAWSQYPLTYADGIVYGRVIDGFSDTAPGDAMGQTVPDNTSHFRAHDADTGELLWSHTIVSDFAPRVLAPHVQTVGAGLMVVASQDGTVMAIGRTDASLQPVVAASTLYPSVGATVTLDAGGTSASSWADAPASTAPSGFRVDWGDGTTTDWQTEPAFSHAYGKAGDHQAVLYVRNDAGQQSAQGVTFDVGGTPPPELNFLQKAFQPKNYDLVFGVLGILLALGGGAIAVTNRRLRHGRLQGEGREARQLAYRRVLAREIENGDAPEQIAERLKPLRGVLGIADREHARLEAEARALRVAAAGGARLLVPGERFLERYEVERQLGAGGAGLTYLCRDVRLGRSVVLKVLRTAGDKATAAALEEARAYAAVDHDRVVTLIDVEQLGDDVYLVLEYVDGRSLAERLADGPLEPEAMRRLAEDLLSALEAVHRAGLVHRDIKPSNVLVTQGGVCKLGDFGLASAALDDETAVGFDGGAGTARYMAPEQARGERVDARSDLYAAALTLLEAWTGTPYYERHAKESLMDVQMRAAHGKGSLEGVPEGSTLRAFFDRALLLDPAGRFKDAATMRAALLEALEGGDGLRRKKGTRPTRAGKDA